MEKIFFEISLKISKLLSSPFSQNKPIRVESAQWSGLIFIIGSNVTDISRCISSTNVTSDKQHTVESQEVLIRWTVKPFQVVCGWMVVTLNRSLWQPPITTAPSSSSRHQDVWVRGNRPHLPFSLSALLLVLAVIPERFRCLGEGEGLKRF